ncbi:UNVERIFIED_ORG: hypothetical protein J2Y81_006158 [Paraburkholderia sediminicola]|uniref:Integrase n=1 Tax=Paraburkholderia nemoris TaxID=2793076 RepID=A0ABM8SQ03_9BURK|nr:hypothetical protein [Paraburkholderia sediminicola]CAE6824712.1 hypothetical protein R69776_06325 [Paraburkholderia nemoris]CAE6891788.1 hypothetical protein R69749_07649 [Paraburkholderia domus]CAE6854951.1 hypothetical protein R75777_07737 [Paraburkholderia nemoris]CAE6855198.1 hypothetical protein R69619_07655 [Paraburkholderia nemoris]
MAPPSRKAISDDILKRSRSHGQTNFTPIRLFPHRRLPVSRHAMLTMEDYLTREISRAHDEDLRHDRGSQVQVRTIKKHT